jgi:uncharacterized protein (DUF1778 family)
MGRPPLSPEKRRTAYIQLRIAPALKRLYQSAATRAGRTLSRWILEALCPHVMEEIRRQGTGAMIASEAEKTSRQP